MKTLFYISMATLILSGCSNKQEQQQIKALGAQDSALMRESGKKDSTILAYVKTMNEIQDNLDSIKTAEKILTIRSGGVENKTSALDDIRSINNQLLKYHKEIYYLEGRLNQVYSQNKEIKKMEDHLEQEIAEKDSSIAVLQKELAGRSDSLRTIIHQFNDSMLVIVKQNGTISQMTAEMHTIHYTIGTIKDLKKSGVITKEGGFAGIGRTATINQNFNVNSFTKGDMTNLNVIPLHNRFEKIITSHPSDSYAVTNNHNDDSLIIKDPATFWSTSKYLVIVIK